MRGLGGPYLTATACMAALNTVVYQNYYAAVCNAFAALSLLLLLPQALP